MAGLLTLVLGLVGAFITFVFPGDQLGMAFGSGLVIAVGWTTWRDDVNRKRRNRTP
jgi:hypothetical protein